MRPLPNVAGDAPEFQPQNLRNYELNYDATYAGHGVSQQLGLGRACASAVQGGKLLAAAGTTRAAASGAVGADPRAAAGADPHAPPPLLRFTGAGWLPDASDVLPAGAAAGVDTYCRWVDANGWHGGVTR